MSPPDPGRGWRLRIGDILECIGKVQRYTQGHDYRSFAGDEIRFDAVLYNITIIGEAAPHVPEEVTRRHPEIPWPRLRGMRNILVHDYHGVDATVIWDTVTIDLPGLVEPLRTVLQVEP